MFSNRARSDETGAYWILARAFPHRRKCSYKRRGIRPAITIWRSHIRGTGIDLDGGVEGSYPLHPRLMQFNSPRHQQGAFVVVDRFSRADVEADDGCRLEQ